MSLPNVLVRLCCALCVLCGMGSVLAQPAPPTPPAPSAQPEHHAWWWSWADGAFGISLGGTTYGSALNRVVGSDKLINDVRPIAGVQAIELRGPVNLVLKQAEAEKLTVHTDDNIAPLIETAVDKGTLRIGVKNGASFRVRHPIGVTVEVPHLNSLRVTGSGDVTCSQFETDLLEITVVGSGNVRFDSLRAGTVAVLIQGSGDVLLSGSAAQQGYVIEGSGDIDSDELAGRNVAVRIAGSGDAKVWATENLSVEIAGSGDVSYRGNAVLKKNVHGSGDVLHKD